MTTAINTLTGENISGEVRGNLFVDVKDVYTGDADVYEIGSEVTLVPDVVADDYPSELDNAFSDADVEARDAAAAVIAEQAEHDAMISEIVAAAAAYRAHLDRFLSVIDVGRKGVKDYASSET